MNSNLVSRIGVLAAAAALAGSALLVAPTAASAQTSDAACEVTGSTLSWGVKESFRAYISGSIANGSWETSDGADYETPEFVWTGGTGTFDPETGTGSVSFVGTVHFTGHDGVLDLTLANPTVEFESGGSAALLLDARSTDMEGEVAVDTAQEWVGDITLDGDLIPSDGVLDIAEQPTTLTNSGAAAFAGFYEAGVELDPVSVTLELDGCDTGVSTISEEPVAEEPVAAAPIAEEETDIPWLPIVIGGVALIVIGLTTGLLLGGRRPRPAPESASDADRTPVDPPADAQ
ncbi:MAG: HtaA domain-containing protein [Candidatus Microbacterium stercoravium]|uniref:HtaA domain-containing protein n=1 Tax=Microbacterium TaxID=33882 RepID=UPI003F94ED74